MTEHLSQHPTITLLRDILVPILEHPCLVGGAVRDILRGLEPSDLDIVTPYHTEDSLLKVLQHHGEVIRVGRSFPVFLFKHPKLPHLEIALPRVEVSTGTLHSDFIWRTGVSVETDLGRRDFSMNSIAFDLKLGKLIDPHEGAHDIELGQIRAHNPHAFQEDPLRILRLFRQAAQTGFGIEEKTLKRAGEAKHLLPTVSRERYCKEISLLFTGKARTQSVEMMDRVGVLSALFPALEACRGVEQNHYHLHDVLNHSIEVLRSLTWEADVELALAALLHDVGKPAAKWVDDAGVAHFYVNPRNKLARSHEDIGADMVRPMLTHLGFPKASVAHVSGLVRLHMFRCVETPRAARRFLHKVMRQFHCLDIQETKPFLRQLYLLRHADLRGGKARAIQHDIERLERHYQLCSAEIAKAGAFTVRDLAINGHDVRAAGFEGPDIGLVMLQLLDLAINHPEVNRHDILLSIVDSYRSVRS